MIDVRTAAALAITIDFFPPSVRPVIYHRGDLSDSLRSPEQIRRAAFKSTGAVSFVQVEKARAEPVLNPQEVPNVAVLPKVRLEANFPGLSAIRPPLLLRAKCALTQSHDFLKQRLREMQVSRWSPCGSHQHGQRQTAGIANQEAQTHRRRARGGRGHCRAAQNPPPLVARGSRDSLLIKIHSLEMEERHVRLRNSSARGLAFHDNRAAPAVRRTIYLMFYPRCGDRAEERVVSWPLPSRKAGAMEQTGHHTLPCPAIRPYTPMLGRKFCRQPDVESEFGKKVE